MTPVGACRGGRVHQERIERHPTHTQSRFGKVRQRHGAIDTHVLVDERGPVQRDGAGGQYRIEDTEFVEDLHAARLDHVR